MEVQVIGCRATGNVLDAYFLEGSPDFVAGFLVYVLHAAEGQVILAEKFSVGKYRKHVREGIAYSEY